MFMGCARPNPLHWEDLRSRSANDIVSRPGVKIMEGGKGYEVGFLNARYMVDHTEEIIREIEPYPERALNENFQILLIRYLVANNGGPETGEVISEKDLPGGVTFFQGPHTLHVRPIVKKFGKDPDGFEELARGFGAVRTDFGDRAMRFYPFPSIPVTYVLWVDDDEFPASVSALFDRSISGWFELDMIFTLVLVLTERIMEGQ
jgi:hypothetical protein